MCENSLRKKVSEQKDCQIGQLCGAECSKQSLKRNPENLSETKRTRKNTWSGMMVVVV